MKNKTKTRRNERTTEATHSPDNLIAADSTDVFDRVGFLPAFPGFCHLDGEQELLEIYFKVNAGATTATLFKRICKCQDDIGHSHQPLKNFHQRRNRYGYCSAE